MERIVHIRLANVSQRRELAIYQHSEDISAITSLLAMMNQDWELAIVRMGELMNIQGDKTPSFTYVVMVRALRCNLDPVRALQVARVGLSRYPEQMELLAEKNSLDDLNESSLLGTSSFYEASSYASRTARRLNKLKALLDQKLIDQDASPKYIKKFGKPKKPSDLAAHECLGFRVDKSTSWKLYSSTDMSKFKVEVSGRFQLIA